MTTPRPSVCLLTNAYPDFPDSSRVVFLRDLARLLSERGWEVSVLAPRIFKGSRARESERAVRIRRFTSFMGNRLLVEYSRTPVVRLIGYMTAGLVSAIGCARRCDVVHAHWVIPAGLLGLIAARVSRRPLVVTAHGSEVLVTAKGSRLFRGMVKFVVKRADVVTSVAEHLTDEIVAMGIPRRKILTFPMSVPTESFRANGPCIEPLEANLIFSNRSLYPIYNLESLIRAVPEVVKAVPDARVIVAGEGPERQRLVSLASELGVAERVRFPGAIPHERMPRYLRSASAYVSTAMSDGASVSLLEAMACGTFPVVADIAANREWVRHGENGLLFAPGDSRALASQVVEALRNAGLRERAREANPKIVEEKAQWNSNVNKLVSLYEEVLGS